jgi:hypothetical protein
VLHVALLVASLTVLTPTWTRLRRPQHRRGGLPLLPVQDRQRPHRERVVRGRAAQDLQRQRPYQHALRLLRRVAGELRQLLLPEPAERQGPPGLRREVARHGEQLRGQPGRLLRRLRVGDEQAREDRGQDGGEIRRDCRAPN